MPTIPLLDVLGLDVNGKLKEGSKLVEFLGQVPKLLDSPLDQVPVDQASVQLNFSQPIDVSAGDLSLRIGAGAGGSLALIRADRRVVDEYDPFSLIAVKQNEIYVAASLNFSLQAGLSGTAGYVSFGISGENEFSLQCDQRFQDTGQGFTTFSQALATAFSSFLLPQNAADLEKISADTILVLSGDGKLTVSGGVRFSVPSEALASVTVASVAKLEVNPSASVGLTAKVTIDGEYEIRLRQLGGRKVELGVYQFKSRALEIDFAAQAGLAVKAAGFEVAGALLSALSSQPVVDPDEFRKALPGENPQDQQRRIDGFESSLKQALSTKLEASLSAAFSRLHSGDAAWLFEIDLDAAAKSDPAAAALASAFAGDFSALTGDPQSLPPGIVQKENVLTTADVQSQTLRLNLLGLVNLVSIEKIAQVSAIERDANGDITLITDTSSVNRLQALLQNVDGNARRLRKMLGESFLVEAVYSTTSLGILPPQFKSRHSFLEIHDSTSQPQMKDMLDVARMLALLTLEEEQRRLGSGNDFGRTTFYAEVKYGNDVVRQIFLNGSQKPRSIDEYETLGRSALGELLSGDEGQEFRLRYAGSGPGPDAFWKNMKDQGPFNFGPLFGLSKDSTDPRLLVVVADFVVITDWAKAMNKAGAAICDVENDLSGGLQADDPRLTAARERLKKRMAEVGKDSGEEFGDPLGMMMVYFASNRNAQKTVIASGDRIERLEASSLQSQGGSAGG